MCWSGAWKQMVMSVRTNRLNVISFSHTYDQHYLVLLLNFHPPSWQRLTSHANDSSLFVKQFIRVISLWQAYWNKQNSAGNCHCLIDIVFIFQMQNNNRSPVMCNQAVGITSANQDPLSLTKKCTASSKEALIHKHLYHYTYHKQISHLVIRRNCNWYHNAFYQMLCKMSTLGRVKQFFFYKSVNIKHKAVKNIIRCQDQRRQNY